MIYTLLHRYICCCYISSGLVTPGTYGWWVTDPKETKNLKHRYQLDWKPLHRDLQHSALSSVLLECRARACVGPRLRERLIYISQSSEIKVSLHSELCTCIVITITMNYWLGEGSRDVYENQINIRKWLILMEGTTSLGL